MRAERIWREQVWRVFLIFLVVFVPLVIVESVLTAWHVPAPELWVLANDPTQISYVIPGGGAESAGVRAGDKILQFNGLAFVADDLPRIIRNIYVGETARLTVQHPSGQVVTLAVPLVPVAKSTFGGLARNTLVALVIWGSSLVLLRLRYRRHEVRLLFLLAQGVALGLLVPSIPFIIWYHSHLVWVNIAGAGAYLSIAILLHFHCSFPATLGSGRQRRSLFGVTYGLTLVAVAGWIGVNYGWLPYDLSLVVLSGMSLIAIGAVVVPLYVYFRRATPDGRRRLRVILFGSLVAVGGAAILWGLPTAILGYPLITETVLVACLSAVPAAYVYATVRHNVFGVDRLLNRALVYALIGLGICVVYAGPLILLDRLVPYDWVRHAFIMAGLTLVVALAFEGTRRRVQQVVDRFFYGGWYDYPKVVELVSAALARSLDWPALADVLTWQVPELMQLRGAQLQAAEQATAPLDAAVQPQTLFSLGGEGQAQARWIVGPRRDGDELSATDRRILKTLARQADIALSNVQLVQALRLQFDEISASRKALTRLEHQLLRTREAERQRLARELHDGPIQSLVGLKMQLDMLAARPEGGGAAGAPLMSMRAEVRALLAELRQVCADLRPPMLDTLGLGAALCALAQDWSAQHEIPVQLDLTPDAAALRALPGEVAVSLYRVVQEALTNAARHASARQVALCLQWAGPADGLRLAIQDDGQGFDPAVPPASSEHGHFGLVAMQERVALIGGQWQLDSAPGRGTAISVLWRPPATVPSETAQIGA
jgi:two-component system NarL family sensor kinase